MLYFQSFIFTMLKKKKKKILSPPQVPSTSKFVCGTQFPSAYLQYFTELTAGKLFLTNFLQTIDLKNPSLTQ